MRLQHWNRIRRSGRDQMVLEVEATEVSEHAGTDFDVSVIRECGPSFKRRNGKPGNTELDWLQAEAELRARDARPLCSE